jgi:hypothetical protein
MVNCCLLGSVVVSCDFITLQATKSLNKGGGDSVPLFPWNAPDWSK